MMIKKQGQSFPNHSLAALLLVLVMAVAVAAQQNSSQYDKGTPPQHAAGISPLNSYISADLGTINLSNGSLNFRIPIGQVGGRGFWLPLTLNYSSKVWSGSKGTYYNPDPAPGHTASSAYAKYDDLVDFSDVYSKVAPGWTVGAAPTLRAVGTGIGSVNNSVNGCTDFTWVVVKLTLVLPDKGEIEFRDDLLDGAPTNAQVNSQSGCRDMDSYRGIRWHATDGSGAVFLNDTDNGVINGDLSGVVILADGMRYHFINTSINNGLSSAYLKKVARCDWIRDRNGNKINIAYPTSTQVQYTDPFNRITTVDYNYASTTGAILTVTLPGYNGATRTYTAVAGSMRNYYRQDAATLVGAQWVFNGSYPTGVIGLELFPGSHESAVERIDDKIMLTQLNLPDGRSLQFKYNQFGEVAEVVMPTGGVVQYDFASVTYDVNTGKGLPTGNSLNAEVFAPQGGGSVKAVDRAIVERRTYPDGNTVGNPEGRWTYDYNAVLSNSITTGNTQVKCYSGAGTLLLDERHYFKDAQRFLSSSGGGVDGTGYSLWSTGLERRSEMLSSTGAVLAASEQDWTQRTTINWTTGYPAQQIASDNRITESRKILDDGSVAKVKTSYDTLGDTHTNSPNRVEEYDFDNTLKRYSTTTYITTNNYLGNHPHLLQLPLQQSVYDGATNQEMARTTYEYDNYTSDGNNLPMVAYSDIASVLGRDASYNDSTLVERGNVTRVTKMVTASSSISSYTRYDVLGNVVSVKDPKGNVSTISYTDDFGTGASPGFGSQGTGGPTYALPTLITSPPPNAGEAAHTARSQYDFATGLLTGFKDRNGIIVQSLYNDAFDRPTQVNTALGTVLENH
ncbi:MAG: hypothetical protein HY231_11565, partial [Acidobacteria bacterium]|nr:hypothetical protein [Acidobacteriota bacterium]